MSNEEKFITIYEKNSEKVYNLVEELRQTTENLEPFNYLVKICKVIDKYKNVAEYSSLMEELNQLNLFKISDSICTSCFIQNLYYEESMRFIEELDKTLSDEIEKNDHKNVDELLNEIIEEEDIN